jgi:nucleoid-associated protein Lsr2
MARRTRVTLEDDLDGGPAAETLRFGIGGVEYEIDLSERNATRLRTLLAPFMEHGRKAGPRPRRTVRTAASRQRSREIRAWARARGIELSERGRIPASVAARYDADAAGAKAPRRLTASRSRHPLGDRRERDGMSQPGRVRPVAELTAWARHGGLPPGLRYCRGDRTAPGQGR